MKTAHEILHGVSLQKILEKLVEVYKFD